MKLKKPQVLVTTNHMADFAGSEILALEVAECFQKLDCSVTICANYIGSPMMEKFENSPISLIASNSDIANRLNPYKFDIIWSQHHVLACLLTKYLRPLTLSEKPFCVFAHLSPYTSLELPGPYIENLFADRIFANSCETASKLMQLGIPKKDITIFYNAAPEYFLNEHKTKQLKKILLISNHFPIEVLNAAEILKDDYDIEVSYIGVQNSFEKILPSHIKEHDAVLTIGKSVQYAILGLRPVYCYDHFGGPGWLTNKNFYSAEEFNYSGRCTNRKISAEQIAEELIYGFDKANNDIDLIRSKCLDKYLLENYIKDILSDYIGKNKHFFSLSSDQINKINTEAALSTEIKNLYISNFELIQQKKSLQISIENSQQNYLTLEEQYQNNLKSLSVYINKEEQRNSSLLRRFHKNIKNFLKNIKL